MQQVHLDPEETVDLLDQLAHLVNLDHLAQGERLENKGPVVLPDPVEGPVGGHICQ